jgi:hypothetical protein
MFMRSAGRISEFGSVGEKVCAGDPLTYKNKLCIVRDVKDNTNNRVSIANGKIPVMTHNCNFFWISMKKLVSD